MLLDLKVEHNQHNQIFLSDLLESPVQENPKSAENLKNLSPDNGISRLMGESKTVAYTM